MSFFFFAAVLFYIIPLSLQQYCRGYNTDHSGCGATVVDGLDLSIICLNSSSVHVTWRNKTVIQLMSLEYNCFYQSSENYTTVAIQGSSNQPKGDLVFTGINITSSDEDYSLCVLFGCVYIDGENCWQLNEGNASCSDDNGSHLQNSAVYSSMSFLGISSTMNSLIYAETTLTLMSYAQTVSTDVPTSFTTIPTKSSNGQLSYVVTIVLSILIVIGVLFGLLLLTSIVSCVIWAKRNQNTTNHHMEHKQDFNDIKISASTYTFTSVSMAGSIVTELNSLIAIEKKSSSAEQDKDTEPYNDQKSSSALNDQFILLEKNKFNGEPVFNNNYVTASCGPSTSLSPTSSLNSYCKMSEPLSETSLSKVDNHSHSTIGKHSASSQDRSIEDDINMLCLQVELKNRDMGSESNHDLSCADNVAVFHKTRFNVCGSNSLPPAGFYQKENENYFEIDFCDIDVNSDAKHT